MASSMGAEGSSGAGSVLDATHASPDDKYKEISQIPLTKLNVTLPIRTGEFFGTDKNLAVA